MLKSAGIKLHSRMKSTWMVHYSEWLYSLWKFADDTDFLGR